MKPQQPGKKKHLRHFASSAYHISLSMFKRLRCLLLLLLLLLFHGCNIVATSLKHLTHVKKCIKTTLDLVQERRYLLL